MRREHARPGEAILAGTRRLVDGLGIHTPRHAMPPPCESVRKHRDEANKRLWYAAMWRWLSGELGACGFTQAAVADAAGIDRSQFNKVANRDHRAGERRKEVSEGVYRKVLTGLITLGHTPAPLRLPGHHPDGRADRELTLRCFQVNGYLLAMNELNRADGSPHKPVGLLHYFCLHRMLVNPVWFQAVAADDDARQRRVKADIERAAVRLHEVSVAIYRRARHEADEFAPHALAEFVGGELYELHERGDSFRRFHDRWQPHWRRVDDCLNPKPPAGPN